jgi:hypothetical protein
VTGDGTNDGPALSRARSITGLAESGIGRARLAQPTLPVTCEALGSIVGTRTSE